MYHRFNRWSNSLDQLNPSIHFVFRSFTKSRASPLTSRSAKAYSTGFQSRYDLLSSYPHFSLVTTSTDFFTLSIPTHRSSVRFFIFKIDGIYWQRQFVADITAIDPRARQVRWRNDIFDYKNLISTMILCRPLRPFLFLSTFLWTDRPSSSRHHHCFRPLLKMRKETWSIQYQRDLDLSPASPDVDEVFSAKSMYEHG